MPLTENQIAWLRSELGATPSDADLNTAYERLGSVRDVAIEEIRKRRNALLEAPATATLTGVGSVSYGENIKGYERLLASLTKLDDDPSDDPASETDGDTARAGGVIQLTRTRRR